MEVVCSSGMPSMPPSFGYLHTGECVADPGRTGEIPPFVVFGNPWLVDVVREKIDCMPLLRLLSQRPGSG